MIRALGLAAIVAALSQTAWSQSSSEEGARTIEEVVVTATKRAKSVRDIPASIDAFNGQDLEERGASGFEDFIKFSPGVSYSPGAPDRATIAVRGVATETSG